MVQLAVTSFLPELVSGRGTAQRSWVVEGKACSRLGSNQPRDRVQVLQNFSRRDANGVNARGCEPLISGQISDGPITCKVSPSVNLDREPSIAAKEIEDVRATWVLPPKFESVRPGAKPPPKQDFRQAHLFAKAPRAARRSASRLWCDISQHSPSTMLRMVPLPETSSGRN